MGELASRRKDLVWGAAKKKGKGNPNFSGGKYTDEKGYIRVLRPDHPHENHGYIYEHRLVMEAHLGRYLLPDETVHHINEIKIDNRIENFFLTSVSEHSTLHREGKRGSASSAKLRRDTILKIRKKMGLRKRGPGGKYA